VASSCECGDERSGTGSTDFLSKLVSVIILPCNICVFLSSRFSLLCFPTMLLSLLSFIKEKLQANVIANLSVCLSP
jgi:hypothetical protein